MLSYRSSLTYFQVPQLTEEMCALVHDKCNKAVMFQYLLCAMYNRPWTITRVEEIERLTRIADFYRALPILSASLTTALLKSPLFEKRPVSVPNQRAFADDAVLALLLAKKLRNTTKFREAFIHVVGFFDRNMAPAWAEHPDLERLVVSEAGSLNYKVMTVLQHLVMAPDLLLETRRANIHPDVDLNPIHDVEFFRRLADYIKNRISKPPDVIRLLSLLSGLLESNLVLDHRTDQVFGVTIYDSHFLCAEIADQDLPWDANEFEF